jgi:uncharacterized membrane protein YedE/YeeE
MPDVFLMALIGGICIGVASILMMILLGRIAGISGIVFSGIRSPLENAWALVFMAGLVLGAFVYHFLSGTSVPDFDVSMPLIISGGLIVGIGTKIGSGCTSGHGICGIGRLSVRSIVATCTFIVFGFITVYIRLHGGLS